MMRSLVTESLMTLPTRSAAVTGSPALAKGDDKPNATTTTNQFKAYFANGFGCTRSSLRYEDLSVDTIKAVRTFEKRVCPSSCQPGERAEGDSCIRVTAAPPRVSGGKKCFTFQGREFCE